MTEKTYPLDIAADMLGCQQKKILTEWAKDVISIIIDFGDNAYGPEATLSIDLKTIPDPNEFFDRFPGESFDPWTLLRVDLTKAERDKQNMLSEEGKRELLRHHGLSGFNIPHEMRTDATHRHKDADGDTLETTAYIFGLWRVNYSDFSREQIQDYYSISPYPAGVTPGDGCVRGTFTPRHDEGIYRLIKKNLRITESEMAVMRKLLVSRPGHQQTHPAPEEIPELPKSHGGVERFALEREKILAAALYVAHHFPKEVGKSFKSHAEAIAKHGYIFWQNEPAPDAGRLAKMLSDAARPPSEWKILGGNAKSK